MTLAHDDEGFLTGPKSDINPKSYARHLEILRAIREDGASVREDMAAVRKALTSPARVKQAAVVSARAAVPTRAQQVKSIKANTAISADARYIVAAGRSGNTVSSSAPANTASPTRDAPARDARGKFLSRAERGLPPASPKRSSNGSSPDGGNEKSDAKERADSGALSSAAASLKQSAGAIVSGVETVDPTLAAAKEVKDLAAPFAGLLRPLGRLFGRNKGSESEKVIKASVPWYKKLWTELRDLNKKPTGAAGGKGFLGSILSKIPGLGLLSKIPGLGLLGRGGRAVARGASSVGGMFRRGAGAAGKALSGGGMIGKLGKGLLRRVPVLGALLAGGSALASIFGDDDPSKSAAENKKDRFSGVGGAVGGIIGGAAGVLGGPLGVVAGAALGDLVGTKIGEWMSTVDWSEVGQSIQDTWSSASDWFKTKWEGVTNYVSESWGKISDLASGAFGAVKDWASEKLGKAKEAALNGVEVVKNSAANVRQAGSNLVSASADAVRNGASRLTGGAIAPSQTSVRKTALLEAMNGNGIKDPKEQAMFMAQMDHESGGFKHYEENLNYGADGLRKTFGKYYKTDAEARADARNPEAIANKVYGGRMGNTEAGDGYKFRGRGAIQLTGKDNYKAVGDALGLDLLNNPDLVSDPANAANIAAWYWKKKNLGASGQAGDVLASTRKINGGTNGLKDRKEKYAQYLEQANAGALNMQTANASTAIAPIGVSRGIAASTVPPKAVSPISTAGAPARYSAAAPDVAKYNAKDLPPLITPIGSNSKGKQSDAPATAPLTQNLADRGMAAIATGGIGLTPYR